MAELADAVSSLVDSFADFPDPASDGPIVEDEVVEYDWSWDPRDLTFTDVRRPSVLQLI